MIGVIPNFIFYPESIDRRDRVDRLGGGVVVFVKDKINCVTRLDLHVGAVECIWLEIKINNKKYLYGTFYIPPNSGQQI